MKFILYFLLLIYSVACSGEIKKEQPSKNKMNLIESPSANALKTQTNINQEHISGKGETHISGAPFSSHLSGE